MLLYMKNDPPTDLKICRGIFRLYGLTFLFFNVADIECALFSVCDGEAGEPEDAVLITNDGTVFCRQLFAAEQFFDLSRHAAVAVGLAVFTLSCVKGVEGIRIDLRLRKVGKFALRLFADIEERMLAQLVFAEMQGRFGDLYRSFHTAGEKAEIFSVESRDDVARQSDGGSRLFLHDDAVQGERLRVRKAFAALLSVHRFQDGITDGGCQREQSLYGNGSVLFVILQESNARLLRIGL